MALTYRAGLKDENKGKSALYRLFRPRDANYETKTNPYTGVNPAYAFNPKNGEFPVINNNYSDHRN